jgi:hypothetical protein
MFTPPQEIIHYVGRSSVSNMFPLLASNIKKKEYFICMKSIEGGKHNTKGISGVK